MTTVSAMKPNFATREEYLGWRLLWKTVYARLSEDIRRQKGELKTLQRQHCPQCNGSYTVFVERLNRDDLPEYVWESCSCDNGVSKEEIAKAAKALHYNRRVAFKMMTLLQDGKVRRDRIIAMRKEITEQPFPLMIPDVRNVDFHYNKGNATFSFLPMWVIRAKGRSYYVNEVEFDAPCSTKERATGSTKGVLRFRRCSIEIDVEGNARVSQHRSEKMVDQITEAA